MRALLLLLALLLPAAAETIPMRFLPGSQDGLIEGHLFTVPVMIGDYRTEFILDTGIGVNVISSKLAQKLGCPSTNVTFTGQRMSGQSVTIPLSYVRSLSLGPHRQQFVTVGVIDFTDFIPHGPEWDNIEGFLSLNFFRTQPFTLDYANNCLRLENPQQGTPVDLTLHDEEGLALTAFAHAEVNGQKVLLEVDCGSDSLILHTRYMPAGLTVKTVEGKDETNHTFLRRFGTLPGYVAFNSQRQSDPRVMFQDIIYDGLIGHDFLKRFTVTFDLAHSLMRLQSRSSTGPSGWQPGSTP